MKILQGFRRLFGGKQRRVISAAHMMARLYAAAKTGRLWGSWLSTSLSANEEIKGSLKLVRDRSRQLERDDDLVNRFLNMAETNVVGPDGMKLENRARMQDAPDRLDEEANSRIEEAWADWGRRGNCTVDGQLSFRDLERLHIRCVLRDGDFVGRWVTGAENPEKLKLHVLDAEQLDDTYHADLGNGRVVKMGVEIGPLGAPERYHILQAHPGDSQLGGTYSNRRPFPAADILHSFMMTRPGQVRGMPMYHTAMTTLHQVQAYIEAAIVNARVGATNMAFIINKSGEELPGEAKEGEKRITDATPGGMKELFGDYDVKSWDPTYPHGEFQHFLSVIEHRIAAGFDTSYSSLTGNLSKVNFSSIRQGTIEVRDRWSMLQALQMGMLNHRAMGRWLLHALATEVLPYGVSEFDRLYRPEWLPRKWDYVNPIQDVQAAVVAIENNLTTLTWELAKKGKTLEDLVKVRQRENQILEAAGIPMLGLYAELLPDNEAVTAQPGEAA